MKRFEISRRLEIVPEDFPLAAGFEAIAPLLARWRALAAQFEPTIATARRLEDMVRPLCDRLAAVAAQMEPLRRNFEATRAILDR